MAEEEHLAQWLAQLWHHVLYHVILASHSLWLDDAPAIGYQLKASLQSKCDVGVIDHSLAGVSAPPPPAVGTVGVQVG